jgi:hypothetical protein
MLSVNTYTRHYVDECRARMESQLAAYETLLKTAGGNTGASKSAMNSAVASFESLFFSNLVLVLDGFFVHRTRALEKKDGNPLNEVRMLCNSILQNQGVMAADKTIKYDPPKSVLKIPIGEEIKLKDPDFVRLFRAFFTEIEAKFT